MVGADQPPYVREVAGVEQGHIGLETLVARDARGLTSPGVEISTKSRKPSIRRPPSHRLQQDVEDLAGLLVIARIRSAKLPEARPLLHQSDTRPRARS